MVKPTIRTQYTERPSYALKMESPSITKPEFQDECDINNIVRKYSDTGLISHLINPNDPTGSSQNFGFATSQTFTEAMHIVAKATETFQQLPSKARAHFQNDPAQFLDATQDEARHDEFVQLGLIDAPYPTPPETPETPSVDTTDAPPPEINLDGGANA